MREITTAANQLLYRFILRRTACGRGSIHPCEAAMIYVNGQCAGYVWHPPYNLEITRLLQAGTNQLKIIVGNTAINALAGSPLPDYKALTKRYGERFKPQDMENLQPVHSGLTGPIRLLPYNQKTNYDSKSLRDVGKPWQRSRV